MPTGLSRPAELAYIAAGAMTRGASAVEFRIRHASVDGPVRDPVAAEDPPDETARFVAGGIELAAATWFTAIPPANQTMVNVREVTGTLGKAEGLCWRGSAVLNPAFLYGSAQRTEILVSFGEHGWCPTYRDTRMLTRVIRGLAEAAVADGGSPIMSLHTPTSPFREAVGSSRGDGSGELVRAVDGPCLRMSVGIDAFETNRRLMFEERVYNFAAEHGLGLRIADRRANRISGEWFKVRDFDAELYRRRRDELFGWAPAESPTTVFVVTLVGPARVGSTFAAVQALEASNIGVLAFALQPLTEIEITHLLVPVAPVRLGRVGDVTAATEPLERGLRYLARDCGLTPRSAASASDHVDFGPALGFQLLRSEATSVNLRGAHSESFYAIWVTWDAPYAVVSESMVIQQVLDALNGKVSLASLAYLWCGRTYTNRVRGLAKLGIAMDPNSARYRAGELSRICMEAQDQARRGLATVSGLFEGEFRIRIAWREKWLGERPTGE
jgi:hypothetical protein